MLLFWITMFKMGFQKYHCAIYSSRDHQILCLHMRHFYLEKERYMLTRIFEFRNQLQTTTHSSEFKICRKIICPVSSWRGGIIFLKFKSKFSKRKMGFFFSNQWKKNLYFLEKKKDLEKIFKKKMYYFLLQFTHNNNVFLISKKVKSIKSEEVDTLEISR